MQSAAESDTNGELKYSDGIAGARTMIALEGNASALQRRFPSGWVLDIDPLADALGYFAEHADHIRIGEMTRHNALLDSPTLQRRLPSEWVLAPYTGDDLRGASLRGANMLMPFHEVYAVRTQDGRRAGLPQLSYIAFVSQARNDATGELAHLHWFTYTEDPAGVPGRYGDGTLASITRSQTFSKERRGETEAHQPLLVIDV